MPLINGQKMACEPCIRGHRSTKCTHANERLMVPVRKPGRPLSSCPHPSSRACSCAAVTAAIPRKQKCRCGTSQPAPSEASNEKTTTTSGNPSPPSPSKAGNTAFRVQKPGSKPAPSRKPSVDLAGLGRMDANQLNIMSSYGGMQRPASVSNGQMASMPDMSVYSGLGLTSAESPFSPESAMYPIFSYPMQSTVVPNPSAKPATNGHAAPSTNGSMAASSAPTPGSCCGGGANRGQVSPGTQLLPTPTATVNGDREHKTNGFGPKMVGSRECVQPTPGVPQQHPNGVVMPAFQPPMAMANGIYPYFSQPTTFNYPPQFGSFLQPLQPEQWKQFMATMNFAQPATPSTFGVAGSATYGTSGTPSTASWTSHQCSCGDTCQCVGCTAHPYNEATQNYVRSAVSNAEAEDGPQARTEANGVAHVANGHVNGCHDRPASRAAANGPVTPAMGQTEGTKSPVAPQTPSDGTSGLSEEQTLSASDFFFVTYPFGDSCAGDTASCPCGDDCQCIGCVIHNNPGPEATVDDSTSV
ncbi:hypothetical protein CDD83_1447 [Cordyceps sp. RAO-2017]|nr:hypothetical protein CDD83_1447 [Cordyceps sp. RAO-2017]